MYICVYVCIYIYIYVYLYLSFSLSLYIYIYISISRPRGDRKFGGCFCLVAWAASSVCLLRKSDGASERASGRMSVRASEADRTRSMSVASLLSLSS